MIGNDRLSSVSDGRLVLLDLDAFFAGELPPEGQVGGFLRRPSPLYGSAVAARV